MMKLKPTVVFIPFCIAFPFKSFAETEQKILVKQPGAFELASDANNLINLRQLITTCFEKSNVNSRHVDMNRTLKTINRLIESGSNDEPPIIRCHDLVSAYRMPTKK